MSDLSNHVASIARKLSEGFAEDATNHDGEPMSAFDYLSDALDIEYVIDRKGECVGARILVALGGPNIWVDTRRGMVDGYWWGETVSVPFTDNIGLDDALSELWACR